MKGLNRPQNPSNSPKEDISTIVDRLNDLDDLQKACLKKRWIDQMAWFDKKATIEKKWYQKFRLTIIIGGLLVPMLVGSNINLSNLNSPESTTQQTAENLNDELPDPFNKLDFYINLLTLVVGLLVAAAAALDEFFQPGQKFRDYRNAAENLQIQGWQYLQLTGPYNQFATHSAAFSTFTRHVEEIIEKDVQRFVSRIDDRLEEDKRKTEAQLQKIEDNQDKLARQIRQQMMQAETERQLAPESIDKQ